MEVLGPILVFAAVGIAIITMVAALPNQASNGIARNSTEVRITSVQKAQTPHNIENKKVDF